MGDPKTTAGKLAEIIYDLILELAQNADHLNLSLVELQRLLDELRELGD